MGDLERRAVLFATRFVKHKVLEEIDEQYLSRNDTTSSEHSSEFEGTGKSEFTNGQFSKPKLPYTSTPRTASTQEFPDFLISPIAESTQTNAIGNSTSGELGQSVLKLQNERKSPKKNKRRSSNENKENSGPQNQKSPNASFSNSKISPFKNRTNNLG
ncbi:hypothetical protein NOX90_03270 [Wolbachia endosymbiont of Anurida maritima]|uniref:hypothetical protein n=1 Tax=Wolbachia endosymbiont of Anurida maritima TaxID=2850562 RepID=UPI0035CFBC51